ncbi:MAG: sulfite exporter TauE/SafE family protein [Gaiellaceae bacterium]
MTGFTATTTALLVLLGFGVGAFGTLVGAGGGFILTPVLLVVYPHDSPQTITAISIAVVFFNAASGSLAYARQRRVDYRSGLLFAAATIPGAVVGALAVQLVPRKAFDAIMVVLLLTMACWLTIGSRNTLRKARRTGTLRRIVDAQGRQSSYRVPLRRGAAFSLVVGFVSSFLGIGGGIIHVPLLVQALGFPVHIATATSHFVLAFMSGTGALTHLFEGSYRAGEGLRRTLALSLGVVGGAQLGARISLRLSGAAIQRLLAVALLALGVRLALGL